MNGISHKQAVQWIHRRLDGLLDESQLSSLDEHLHACEFCRTYAAQLDSLPADLQSKFHARWDGESGHPRKVLRYVTAKARRIPLSNRISSGAALLTGAVALILLGIAINFVVSRLQSTSPTTNATVAVDAPLPQDRLLAFASDQNGNFDIYTMHADGRGLTNLTNNAAMDISPFWSPDGQRVAFTSDRDGTMQIYLMDADGSNVTQLTKGEGRYAFDINGFTPWSPDGRKLVFFHLLPGEQDTTIQVMDITDQNIITLINEPGQYLLPSWSRDGRYIAFDANTSQTRVDLFMVRSDGTHLTKLTENLRAGEFVLFDYRWSRDGETLAFIAAGGTYNVVYTADPNGSLAVAQRVGENQHILDWWNGIALLDDPGGTLTWLRPDGSQSTLDHCRNSQFVGIPQKRSSRGNLVFAINCSGNEWVFYWANPDGTVAEQLLDSPISIAENSLFNLTWSPDDRYIAFVGMDTRTLYVLDVVKAREDPSTRPLVMADSFGPSWQPAAGENISQEIPTSQPKATPKGLLAFTSDRNGNSDIYTMHADSNEIINLTNNPANDRNPFWSPDGKHIAFESDRDGVTQIYLMNADGSDVTRLTHDESYHLLPFNLHGESDPWSQDGKKLLFLRQEPGAEPSTLYSLEIESGTVAKLANGQVQSNNLSWSPDGKYVGYVLNDSPTPEATFETGLYIIDTAGNDLIAINELLPQIDSIDKPFYYWSRDGKSIVFIAYRHLDEGRDQWIAYEFVLENNQLIERATSSTRMEDWWEGTSFIGGDISTLTWLRSDGTFNTFKPLERCDLTAEASHGFMARRSPNGSQLINIFCPNKEMWFYYANSDGTIIKPLMNSPIPSLNVETGVSSITWSSDDQFIAVTQVSPAKSSLYIFNVKDPSIQPREIVLSSGEFYAIPSWQPVR